MYRQHTMKNCFKLYAKYKQHDAKQFFKRYLKTTINYR